jgi:hypothetical protein
MRRLSLSKRKLGIALALLLAARAILLAIEVRQLRGLSTRPPWVDPFAGKDAARVPSR